MKIDKFVSVIAPLQNDGKIVKSFIEETVSILEDNYTNYELVLMDDGSDDGTSAVVETQLGLFKGIRYQRLSRRFGEEVAITAGLDTAIGDYVVVMLPHMDPPRYIPDMVKISISGIDVVFGIRTIRPPESLLTQIGSKLFYSYCKRFLKLDYPENSTQFRCLSRQAVNAITQIKDTYRYLRLFSSYVGYERESFDYEPDYREGRLKQRSFMQSVSYAIGLILENSTHPLRFVSWLGLIAAAGNLVYGVYIFAVYFFKKNVLEGWTTLSLQSAAEFFFLTLILTAFCEYLGRILTRLQDRPLYYVREEKNSAVLLIDTDRMNIVEELKHMDDKKDS